MICSHKKLWAGALAYRVYVASILDNKLDVSGAYPNTQDIMNMSRETTFRELSRIKGVPEPIQRRTGINLTSARTNAVEICCDVLKAPLLDDLLAQFEKDLEQGLI